VPVTASSLLVQLIFWTILVLALRGLQAGTGGVTVTWAEALAAYSFARVALVIPVTPGGLGTVDAALSAVLAGFGATGSQALAADLVWRAATYVPWQGSNPHHGLARQPQSRRILAWRAVTAKIFPLPADIESCTVGVMRDDGERLPLIDLH